MKKFLAFIFCLFPLLVACSDSSAPAENTTQATSSPASNQTVYHVYTQQLNPPYILTDGTGNASGISGFEYDILQAIAEKEGFKTEYTIYPWDILFATLDENKADILSAGITANDERKAKMDFSNPFFESQLAVMMPKGSEIRQLKQLTGKKVAVKRGTTQERFLATVSEGQPMASETVWQGIQKVMNKDVDAVLGDFGTLSYYAKQYPEHKLVVITDDATPKEPLAFAVKKGNTELQQKLNSGLAKIKKDGTYQQIYEKWLGK